MEIDNNKLQPSIITEEFDAYTSRENVNSIDNSNTSITTQLVPDSYKAKLMLVMLLQLLLFQ